MSCCMAALACGEDRLDSTVTAPPVCWPELPDTEVAHPLSSAAAPTVPSPARKCRRVRPGVFIVDLPVLAMLTAAAWLSRAAGAPRLQPRDRWCQDVLLN